MFHVEGVFGLSGKTKAPEYCADCGRPYPWTASKLDAARAMADELDGLTEAQRLTLKASIDDIAGETPTTQVAVVRVKKLISQVPSVAGEAIRKLVVDVASETAKKLLTGK